MEEFQTTVNDTTVSAEPTASEPVNTEQTANTNTDTSAEKSNTEPVEGKGEGTKSDLDNKSIPYYRFKEVNSENQRLKAELETFKNQSQPQQPQVSRQAEASIDPVQREQALKALNALGVPTMELIQQEARKIANEVLAEDRVYREMDAQANALAKEWDGTDGKPKFVVDDVVEYGKSVGVYDIKTAFELMNSKQLAEYYAKQAKAGLKTERAGKPVQNVGVDEEALKKEAMATGDVTNLLKHRL